MARAHFVQLARKDNPAVKKGESYWWWKFRYSPRRYSPTKPPQSQLTNSPFMSEVYSIQEEMGDLDVDGIMGMGDVELENWIERIQNLGDECQDSLDNMPEQIQETSTSGELLNDRIQDLEAWANELESVDTDIEDGLEEVDLRDRCEEILAEIQNCQYQGA